MESSEEGMENSQFEEGSSEVKAKESEIQGGEGSSEIKAKESEIQGGEGSSEIKAKESEIQGGEGLSDDEETETDIEREEGSSDDEETETDIEREEGSSEDEQTESEMESEKGMPNDEEKKGEEGVIMDEMWKEFPPELHEKILQFIPIPELYRLRTVSPAWNDLIKQPRFAAKVQPQAMYIFRTPKIVALCSGKKKSRITRNLNHTWRIHDLSTHKSFPLSMQFLYAGVANKFGPCDHCITMAADRGFVSVIWISPTENYEEAIQITNPITRSVVEIPPLCQKTGTAYYSPAVLMVVAEDYSEFTLYIVQEWDDEFPHRNRSFRFNSNVGEWRGFPKPPQALTPSHILKLDSTLYTLFWDMESEDADRPQLFAFDTVRDVWRGTGVTLPEDVIVPRLATALGRLFFVGFGGDGVQLLEVDVGSTTCTVVASMEADGNDFVDEVYWLTVDKERVGTSADVLVLGWGGYIVFSSVTGATVAYDLVNSRWCEWVESEGIENHQIRCGMYAMPMSLTLNPVPEVHTIRQRKRKR